MAFPFRIELEDVTPADPPVLQTPYRTGRPGDTIPLGADRMLLLVETRFDDVGPVLVVERV